MNPDNSNRDGQSGDEILSSNHQVSGKEQVVNDNSQPGAKVSCSSNEGCS